MLNELVELFGSDDFIAELKNEFINLGTKIYECLPSKLENGFVDFGDHYELRVGAKGNVDENGIDIVMDNDKEVSVSVKFENGNTKCSTFVTSTIPSDAIADSLTAELSNGVVVVRVDKMKK